MDSFSVTQDPRDTMPMLSPMSQQGFVFSTMLQLLPNTRLTNIKTKLRRFWYSIGMSIMVMARNKPSMIIPMSCLFPCICSKKPVSILIIPLETLLKLEMVRVRAITSIFLGTKLAKKFRQNKIQRIKLSLKRKILKSNKNPKKKKTIYPMTSIYWNIWCQEPKNTFTFAIICFSPL